MDAHAADVLQPDIYWAGGISEMLKIAALASTYDLVRSWHARSAAWRRRASRKAKGGKLKAAGQRPENRWLFCRGGPDFTTRELRAYPIT
jgi:hypothetical protein